MISTNLCKASLFLFMVLFSCFSLFADDIQKDLEYNLRLLENTISSGQNQVESLKDELCNSKKYKEKIIRLNNQLEESKKHIAELENSLDIVSGKLRIFVNESNKTKEYLITLRQQLSQIKEEAARKDELLAEYKDKITALESKDKVILLLKDRLSKSEQKNKPLLAEIDRLKKVNLVLSDELESLRQKVASENKAFDKDRQRLNSNIKELTQEISRLKKSIKNKDKIIASIKNKNDYLKKRQKDLERLRKELVHTKKTVDRFKEREDKLSTLQGKLKDSIDTKKRLLAKIDKITNELAVSHSQADSLRKERDDLYKELSRLKNNIELIRDKDERISLLEEKIKNLSNKQKELLERKRKEDEELAYLKNELSRFKNELAPLGRTYKMKSDSYALDNKDKIIASLREKVNSLLVEQDNLRKEKDRLLQESSFLRSKLAQIKAKLKINNGGVQRMHRKVSHETSTEKIKQLKEQLDIERTMYSQQVARLNIEVASLKDKLRYTGANRRGAANKGNGVISDSEERFGSLPSAEKKHPFYAKNNAENVDSNSDGELRANKTIVKVYLKNGMVLTGKLLKDYRDYIKVERVGIALSYFKDEIEKIEIVKSSN